MFNKFLNKYYYDLFIRYTNLSIYLLSYYLKNLKNLKNLENKLPIVYNLFLDEFILKIRKLHIFIGLKKNINNIYSYLGKNIIYFKNFKNKPFVLKITYYLYISNYIFNVKYNNLKIIYIFNSIYLSNNYFSNYFEELQIQKKSYNFYSLNQINTLHIYNNILQINIKSRLIYFIRTKRKYYNLFYNLRHKKINKYIKLLRNKIIFDKVKNIELSIYNILYNSFFLSKIDIKWLFLNNYIYLNGYNCDNLNKNIIVNDRVQIKMNKNVFITERLNFSILVKKKFKILNFYKKYNKLLNFKKKIFLNWVNNFYDIPKFIEIDFSILTIFILYSPINQFDFNLLNLYYKSLFNFNFLNWKILF